MFTHTLASIDILASYCPVNEFNWSSRQLIFFCKPKCVNAMRFAGQVLCMLFFLKDMGRKNT